MNFVSKIPVLRSFARAYALTKFKNGANAISKTKPYQ